MNVPAGQLGAQLQGLLNHQTGSTTVAKDIPITIGVGGTYKDPKPTLILTDQKQAVKEEVKEQTEEIKKEVTEQAQQKAQEAVEEAAKGTDPKDIVDKILKPDTTKTDSTNNATQQLQNKLNTLLKKKKNN